jgi:hypothetical protein
VKIAYFCGFLGFSILALAVGANPFGYAFLLIAFLSGVGALIMWLGGLKWGRDPYDLGELERIDKEERRRAIEEELEEIDSAGNAICLNCGTHFDPLLNICPRCGKSLFQ